MKTVAKNIKSNIVTFPVPKVADIYTTVADLYPDDLIYASCGEARIIAVVKYSDHYYCQDLITKKEYKLRGLKNLRKIVAVEQLAQVKIGR